MAKAHVIVFHMARFRYRVMLRSSFRYKRRPASDLDPGPVKDGVQLGKYFFYPEQQFLELNGETALTNKEARLLSCAHECAHKRFYQPGLEIRHWLHLKNTFQNYFGTTQGENRKPGCI